MAETKLTLRSLTKHYIII